jgi:3-(3-hydroxy-phenyl)propionate hydroxylase
MMDLNYQFTEYPFSAPQHAAAMPACVDGVESAKHPVIIIGAGPVGLTLALSLANHGVRCVVIEQDASVCYGSRAICISRRSLQIFDRLGVLDRFMEKGLPWTEGRSYFKTEEVLHFSMPHDAGQNLPPMLNIQQFYIEHFLAEAAARRTDLIDIRWNSTITQIRNDSRAVRINVSTPLGNYVTESEWLVACDGGRSFVREQLALELKGTSYEGRYVVADIHLKSSLPTGRLAWFDPPSNPGSSILMHKQPDDVWRIDYQLGAEEDADEAIKPAAVIPRVKSHLDMMGESRDWSPIWITIYKAHALTLDRYRVGRTLFAGDAAHLLPIFGVRGANSGIDDADNLGWKLALVLNSGASAGLVDTYSEERVFAARENLSFGAKSTEFMTPPSFAFEMMRSAVLSLAKSEESVRPLINPRQSAPVEYTSSSLNLPELAPGEFSHGPRAGTVLPDARVALICHDGRRDCFLTQALSLDFSLLYFSDVAPPKDILAAVDEVGSRLGGLLLITISRSDSSAAEGPFIHDPRGFLSDGFDARPGTAYLVRPDGYILARWRHFDAERLRSIAGRIVRISEGAA